MTQALFDHRSHPDSWLGLDDPQHIHGPLVFRIEKKTLSVYEGLNVLSENVVNCQLGIWVWRCAVLFCLFWCSVWLRDTKPTFRYTGKLKVIQGFLGRATTNLNDQLIIVLTDLNLNYIFWCHTGPETNVGPFKWCGVPFLLGKVYFQWFC